MMATASFCKASSSLLASEGKLYVFFSIGVWRWRAVIMKELGEVDCSRWGVISSFVASVR